MTPELRALRFARDEFRRWHGVEGEAFEQCCAAVAWLSAVAAYRRSRALRPNYARRWTTLSAGTAQLRSDDL